MRIDMTLFALTHQQKEYLLENLFDYEALKRKGEIPPHIMYYADRHLGMAGFYFLAKGKMGVQYQITQYGLQGQMIDLDTTYKMIYYMDSKSFTMIPADLFQQIKMLIMEQSRQ